MSPRYTQEQQAAIDAVEADTNSTNIMTDFATELNQSIFDDLNYNEDVDPFAFSLSASYTRGQ